MPLMMNKEVKAKLKELSKKNASNDILSQIADVWINLSSQGKTDLDILAAIKAKSDELMTQLTTDNQV